MGRTCYLILILVVLSAANCADDSKGTVSGEDAASADASLEDDADVALSEDTGADAPADTGTDTRTDTGTDTGEAVGCEPSYESWQRNAKPLVETYCSKCHGNEPQFGAPYPLLDYDELLAGEPGERKVDLMAERLLDGSMPPVPNAQPDHVALDTLVEWATCGEQHPDHSEGLQASAPVWQAPPNPPAGAEQFDVTASEYPVGLDTIDRYQCFVIDAPVDVDRFIQRLEPVIDDGRVLHHLLVSIDRNSTEERDTFRCSGFPPGDGYVYVWAPGQGPIEFEEGGLRISPGDKFVLQIHYNNGAGAEDVRDSSGFRVYHSAPEGTEYGLASIGPTSIYVPPGAEATTTGSCEVKRDVSIRATWPHMHEIGAAFNTVIKRVDGTVEPLIELTGWSFEAQLIYDTPVMLHAGDRLETTCTFNNPHDHAVRFGEGTGDEMCYNFLYISPPMDSPCQ